MENCYCRCGYAVGTIVREKNRTRLGVYRWAVSPMEGNDSQGCQQIIAKMDAGDVSCSHCGNISQWQLSDRLLDDLIARRRRRNFGLAEEERHG
jgi:hypothetical protein